MAFQLRLESQYIRNINEACQCLKSMIGDDLGLADVNKYSAQLQTALSPIHAYLELVDVDKYLNKARVNDKGAYSVYGLGSPLTRTVANFLLLTESAQRKVADIDRLLQRLTTVPDLDGIYDPERMVMKKYFVPYDNAKEALKQLHELVALAIVVNDERRVVKKGITAKLKSYADAAEGKSTPDERMQRLQEIHDALNQVTPKLSADMTRSVNKISRAIRSVWHRLIGGNAFLNRCYSMFTDDTYQWICRDEISWPHTRPIPQQSWLLAKDPQAPTAEDYYKNPQQFASPEAWPGVTE